MAEEVCRCKIQKMQDIVLGKRHCAWTHAHWPIPTSSSLIANMDSGQPPLQFIDPVDAFSRGNAVHAPRQGFPLCCVISKLFYICCPHEKSSPLALRTEAGLIGRHVFGAHSRYMLCLQKVRRMDHVRRSSLSSCNDRMEASDPKRHDTTATQHM